MCKSRVTYLEKKAANKILKCRKYGVTGAGKIIKQGLNNFYFKTENRGRVVSIHASYSRDLWFISLTGCHD
jgi:hypothetical protein